MARGQSETNYSSVMSIAFSLPTCVGDGIFITVFLLCRHLNQLTNLFFSSINFYYHQTWALEKYRGDSECLITGRMRKTNYTGTKW